MKGGDRSWSVLPHDRAHAVQSQRLVQERLSRLPLSFQLLLIFFDSELNYLFHQI